MTKIPDTRIGYAKEAVFSTVMEKIRINFEVSQILG